MSEQTQATRPRFNWRRLFQFRLRTLLIVTTIIAVLLGWWSHTARQQRMAVAALRNYEAKIYYNHMLPGHVETEPTPFADEPPGFSQWLVDNIGIDYFGTVGAVNAIGNPKLGDKQVELLRTFSSLEWLRLDGAGVTDASLTHLANLKKLQTLGLGNTLTTDAGLEHLQGLTNLEKLYLEDTQVTDAGVARLQKALPNCQIYR